jgi:hypothetical protein
MFVCRFLFFPLLSPTPGFFNLELRNVSEVGKSCLQYIFLEAVLPHSVAAFNMCAGACNHRDLGQGIVSPALRKQILLWGLSQLVPLRGIISPQEFVCLMLVEM